MKRNTRTIRFVLITLLSLALLAIGLWAAGSAMAGPAAQGGSTAAIPYQGRLTGDGGQPVADGAYDFTFEVYEALTGGAPLWAETQTGVAVRDGYFSVLLGSVNPLGAEAAASDRYLAVAVRGPGEEGFTALEPRQKLPDPTVVAQQVICGASAAHDHWGETWSGSGIGLRLESSDNYGLYGTSTTSYGIGGRGIVGVRGFGTTKQGGLFTTESTDPTEAIGARGIASTTVGTGVRGHNCGSTGTFWCGPTTTDNGVGVYGYSKVSHGVRGETDSTADYTAGVVGKHTATSGPHYGVQGWSDSSSGMGVYGYASSGTGTASGVYGWSKASLGYGVYGRSDSATGFGVFGYNSAGGWAGYFSGDVNVLGTLSKGGGGFNIDHPLDPENKYLSHSFVESPDMMNVYNGNVVLDANGEVWVELPDYFEALNRDFRYQLTSIGVSGPNLYIAAEISGNRFKIAGGQPGSKVSWQVTGIRQDPYANANRIPVEEEKPEAERGFYLHPEVYGQPRTMGIE